MDYGVKVVVDLRSLNRAKSFWRTRPQAGADVRYHLLETVREYAADRLREQESDDKIREQHRRYFLGLAEKIFPEITGPKQKIYLEQLETEHNNLRQVLAFCETADAPAVEKGLRLMNILAHFWFLREHLNEGRQHCAALLARAQEFAPTSEGASAWVLAGNIALCMGDNPTARRYFETSLALRKQLGDRRGLAGTLGSLGTIAQRQGDFPAAQSYFEESVNICREFGLLNYEATGLTCLSNVASEQGNFAEAGAYAREALEVCRRVGNTSIEGLILNGLGIITMAQKDYADAVSCFEQALAVNEKVGHSLAKASALSNRSYAFAFSLTVGLAK